MPSLLLPLISLAVGILPPGPGETTATPDGTEEPALSPHAIERIETPRVAQVRLAETLIDADAIHTVTARGPRVTFVIADAGLTLDVVATIGAAFAGRHPRPARFAKDEREYLTWDRSLECAALGLHEHP